MNAKRVNSSAPTPPQCPRCAQAMRLVRKTLRFSGLPDLYAFECRTCDVSHIEEGGAPREITPNKTEIGSWIDGDGLGGAERFARRSRRLQPIPFRRSTEPRGWVKPSKIRDVDSQEKTARTGTAKVRSRPPAQVVIDSRTCFRAERKR